MRIKNFYGNYSSGAAFDGMEDSFFSKKNIFHTTKIIKKNLKKMSISENDLKDKMIMNVGSGRESLGLLKFKPKKIFHYDISRQNIKRFSNYIAINNLETLITSNELDLSKNNLPKNKFDFIYLHGIIQHTDHVNRSLKNLILSMKLNGKMWFYFYRPGSLNIFLGSIQRYLLKNKKIKTFKKFSDKGFKKNFVDGIMDDCYVPNRQLFYPSTYNKNLRKNGLINFGNTFLKNYDYKVDFLNYHESVTFFLKKNDLLPISVSGFKRKDDVNVLDEKLYKSKKYIKVLQILNSIKKNKQKNVNNIFNLVVEIEKIKIKVVKIFFKRKKLTKKEFGIMISSIYKLCMKI